jgi:hypothetical protein
MYKILIVLWIGAFLRSCEGQGIRGGEAAALARINCVRENPGGVTENFTVNANPSPKGKCYAKCLLKAIKVITVVNAKVEGVHVKTTNPAISDDSVNCVNFLQWTRFEDLIDDSTAKAGLKGCKRFIVQDIARGLDDFCSSVLAVHNCMESNYPGTVRAAFLKYFQSAKGKFDADLIKIKTNQTEVFLQNGNKSSINQN